MPEIPAYPALSPAKADDVLVVLDVHDTSASSQGTVKKSTAATVLGVAQYVFPSGDSTGATDTAAINAVLTAGGKCMLVQTGTNFAGGQTPYYINAPLTPATGSSLIGGAPAMASNADSYGAGAGGSSGTVIYVLPGFSGAAAISMSNTTTTQYYGVTLKDFSLEMYQMPAGYGILAHGAWGACVMSGVNCNGAYADNLHFEADATTTFGPDDWRVEDCKFSASYTGYGVWADNIPDSWFSCCESSENKLDNWWIGFSLNTRLVDCKGENSTAGCGFHLTGQGGAGRELTLLGCSTHLNFEHGYLFDGTSAGSAGGNYLLVGCRAVSDNQAASTYSGFAAVGSVALVQGTNCYAYGATYGAAQVSSSTGGMVFTASNLSGVTGSTHDDGSNTSALVNQVPSTPGQVVDAEQFAALTTTYTLASGTTLQKLFNATANGALSVQGSTSYFFECAFDLSGMAATTTNGNFSFGFGGTATLTSVRYTAYCQKSAAVGTPATAQVTVGTAATATALVSASGTTTGTAFITGTVRINAAGTLIPEVALGVSTTTAVVAANARFRIWPVGTSTTTSIGSWT